MNATTVQDDVPTADGDDWFDDLGSLGLLLPDDEPECPCPCPEWDCP